ncbi:MAG: four helix bundle protein [Flavobacteriales bacterium]|nr:four helix bundle protein [Flavobacteriales bacterium]
MRSGISIGANLRGAQGAESNREIIHKKRISLKEAEGTNYWLSLCNLAEEYPRQKGLLDKSVELIKY